MPEILTDEMATLLWTGQPLPNEPAAVVPKKVDPVAPVAPANTNDDDDSTTDPVTPDATDDAISKALGLDTNDDDDDDSTTVLPKPGDPVVIKKGRKATDLVSTVSKLVEDGELFGFEDGEIKTNEEAVELLKLNFKEREKTASEEGWKEKTKQFSPQVQAILHYAEQGAQSATEIMQLMGAIKEMEDVYDFDISTPEGQDIVIRQYYKSKGFKDNMIEKQVGLLKDSGAESKKEAAEQFLPELIEANEQKVAQKIREQEGRKARTEEASRIYLTTVAQVLKKDNIGDVPVTREDKAKVYEAVANPRYTSINGSNTTQFVRTLEELQFGDQQNYDHFLNIVRFTVDPKGFIESLKKVISADVTASTVKSLRTSKTTTPNSVQEDNRTPAKKVVKRDFVNPFN